MEERTGQRGFPLCDSPTPGVKQYKIKRSTANSVCGLRATSSRVAAVDAHPVSFPRSGCRRRRDGRGCLSVLPETGWKPPHSRSRSQAATSHFHSSARRRSVSRHAGGIPKGRALRRVFCPALFCTSRKGLDARGITVGAGCRRRQNTPTNSDLQLPNPVVLVFQSPENWTINYLRRSFQWKRKKA